MTMTSGSPVVFTGGEARTGQTSSVNIASAVFQSRLDAELRRRIHMADGVRFVPCVVWC
jgi:hypothetical protein